MKKRDHLISSKKYVCLFVIASLSASLLYGQPNNTANLVFKRVTKIDKDSILSNKEKLENLLQLKNSVEKNYDAKDSGYVLALIKIAKYEHIVNSDDHQSIQYSLSALNTNNLLQHPVSNNILINCCFNLATYYNTLLQQNKAIAFYDTVITLCKQLDPDDYVIESRLRKSDIYSALGDYQKEIDECTLGITDAVLTKDTLHLISFLNLRADALTYLNKFTQAFSDLEAAISIEQIFGNSNWLATSYKEKAVLYKNQKLNKEAEIYFLKSIDTRPHFTGFYEIIAMDYNELARFYLNNLNNFAKAKANYFKTLEYANKCLPAVRPLYLLISYINLGELYQNEKKTTESIYYYQKAFEQINCKTNDFLFTNPSLTSLSLMEYNADIFALLSNKAELLLELYKKNHQPRYLQACLQTALLTDSIITQTRHQNISDGSKLYWRDETREFFENAIEACYLANDVNKAFYFMEKSRAVLLNDRWNELGANAHLPGKETAKQEYLETKVIEQKQLLSTFQPYTSEYNKAENNLLITIDTLDHFIKSLEKNYPLYYQSKYADNVPSLQSLQTYLAGNSQSLVHYFMNDTSIYALGIIKNKTGFIKISAADFDSHQLSAFIHLCSVKKDQMNNYPAFALLSQTIYKKLFQPLQIPKGNVAICTDNFFIPFEALCTDEKGKNYLLYDYNFSYVYSARSLLKSVSYSAPTGNFIGFAPVSFSSSLGVFDLKQSASALQNVAHFYSNHTLLTQQKATRNHFISQASHYSVVTIFSHAQADTTDAEPVLYMQDSLVRLSDLQRFSHPSVQFVLLSACQTNIGKNATGEGIYSLARGFASAGISSVAATLWKADEGAIYQISVKFNEYLSQGMNKGEALQKAKIWYLQNNSNNEYSLPFYWANMVLIGSSQPVVLSSSNHQWIWMTGIGFIIILLAMMAYVLYYKTKTNNAQKSLATVV